MTALETLVAGMSDADRDFVRILGANAPELLVSDDDAGVQKRFEAVSQTFFLCLSHEMRRAASRGVDPKVILSGLTGVLAALTHNVAMNFAADGCGEIDVARLAAFIADRAGYTAVAHAMGASKLAHPYVPPVFFDLRQGGGTA